MVFVSVPACLRFTSQVGRHYAHFQKGSDFFISLRCALAPFNVISFFPFTRFAPSPGAMFASFVPLVLVPVDPG